MRDLRHEFCDCLMPYFWPDNPILKRFNLSNEAREAIAKILAIAESRQFASYMPLDKIQNNSCPGNAKIIWLILSEIMG